MRRALLLCAAAFAALAALVAAGALTGIDQWAATHVMPGLAPSGMSEPTLVTALRPVSGDRTPFHLSVDGWLYPASVPISFLLVGLCATAHWRRGRRLEAALWAAAWVSANALEVLIKHLVHRPAIYGVSDGSRYHVFPFDDSFPSGHALRSTLVAAAVLAVAPRLGAAALAWAVSVWLLLVPAAWHTPSDVVGGVLLAAVLVLGVQYAADAGGERVHVLLGRVPRGHPADDA